MAPAVTQPPIGTAAVGPHPSFINVSNQYLFQQQIQGMLLGMGTNTSREDTFRLMGIQWIDDVRLHLQLPARTFCTACTYYHKFRLAHKDNEYQFHDAAAAALLAACKVEDTLKKSKEIICAAHNLKVAPAEYTTPDDATLDGPSKVAIGLERLMLEASGFDFRSRFAFKQLIKLTKKMHLENTYNVAYNMLIDLYRTFSPLKHTSATMSFAVLELASLVVQTNYPLVDYGKFSTTRNEVIEAMLDLMDLYTHYQKATIVGPDYPMDRFIQIQIKINNEIEGDHSLSRYTEFHQTSKTNGRHMLNTPKTPITPASPADIRFNGNAGVSPAANSPHTPGSGPRGGQSQDGTAIRFMLDAEQAKAENNITAEYFRVEYEEYEVEVEEPIKPERDQRPPQQRVPQNGYREDRGGYQGGFHPYRGRGRGSRY